MPSTSRKSCLLWKAAGNCQLLWQLSIMPAAKETCSTWRITLLVFIKFQAEIQLAWEHKCRLRSLWYLSVSHNLFPIMALLKFEDIRVDYFYSWALTAYREAVKLFQNVVPVNAVKAVLHTIGCFLPGAYTYECPMQATMEWERNLGLHWIIKNILNSHKENILNYMS